MLTVIESQTNKNWETSVITTQFSDESLANQKFYQILSFASVSDVYIHTATILNEAGAVLRNESFTHETQEES